MSKNFIFYLICILLIIIFLSVFALLIAKKIKNRRKTPEENLIIKCGNVSVLFDYQNNVTVIPYAKDKYGVGRATGGPQVLLMPYSAEKLGSLVRRSMKMCENGKTISSHELMGKLNFTNWKEFSAGKRSLSINYIEGRGIVFNTTIRRPDGSYQFNHFGIEKALNNDTTDKKFGDTILEMLQRCK